MVIEVRVEKNGRVMIPKVVRERLGLKEGVSTLLMDFDDTPVRVTTRERALAQFQEALSKYGSPDESWADSLSEDRRREAREAE